MNVPTMLPAQQVAPDTHLLPAYVPLPGMGVIPVHAFVIQADEPVLVDTGLGGLADGFMAALGAIVAPEDLRWIWLTHTDADHVGNIERVLAAAPRARVVTTFLGVGKLGLHRPLPPDRVFLLNPGQALDVGDRTLSALRPPTFDAPETTALLDSRTRALFSADSFGAVLAGPAADAAEIGADALREGIVTWTTVDSPWLHDVDEALLGRSLERVERLAPSVVLSSHLPPARRMTRTLTRHLAAARTATPFVGPDQAALARMLDVAA
jgi:glyoxylase-like metal-dependent hydrolase (beta-lactamase superfamily II)